MQLFLKCENLQKTGSFKVRGALNKLSQLDAAARARGVVTVSAGNHAQALAWAARAAGVERRSSCRKAASPAKVDASRGYGAEVVLHGASEHRGVRASARAREGARPDLRPSVRRRARLRRGGNRGSRALEQAADLDVVVIPIGGGGLIAGMLVAIKESNPKIRVYGVEPTGAPSMRRSLDAGHAVRLESVNTIADGLAAPMAGELNYEIVRKLRRRRRADRRRRDCRRRARAVVQRQAARRAGRRSGDGGGAAARDSVARPRERVAAVVSGGNIDIPKLTGVLARASHED